jgi:hypothetical protein
VTDPPVCADPLAMKSCGMQNWMWLAIHQPLIPLTLGALIVAVVLAMRWAEKRWNRPHRHRLPTPWRWWKFWRY